MCTAVTRAFDAKGLQFAVQDGPASGQTVPHLHIHVLPRRPNDFARNHDEYEAIEGSERQLTRLDPVAKGEREKERVNRSAQEMAAEADMLRDAMQSTP